MANFSQLRGMLLEEAILYLLRVSGYKTVDSADGDETLESHTAGIAVKGRGGRHQIDAIADFAVTPPFSHPQRLLLEAKCYNKPIGIGVARNGFGVLCDVEEFWVSSPTSTILKKRYHYQYAIASISGFSSDIQEYAYAHDIYLLALEGAAFFQNVKDSINSFSDQDDGIVFTRGTSWLHNLRLLIRNRLRGQVNIMPIMNEKTTQLINNYVTATQDVGEGFIALLNGRFPVMLIPASNFQPDDIRDINVRIFRGEENRGWYITGINSDVHLFSFDIPREMFDFYASSGELTKEKALDLKEQNLGRIQLIITFDGRVRIVTLTLDSDWINQLREGQNTNN